MPARRSTLNPASKAPAALLGQGASDRRRTWLRVLASVVLFALCLLGAVTASRTGRGRFLANAANHSLIPDAADRAVALSPADPETHSSRALVLYQTEDLRGVLAELEQAVVLRPQDYLLWLQLGRARDEAGDAPGALVALGEAVKRAPFYADPRWQYGNVLYRSGRFAESFPALASAARSDPSLAPVLMDLVWGTCPGDLKTLTEIVAVDSDAGRIALARFLVKKGSITEALALFRAAGHSAEQERTQLLKDLLQAKQFRAAHEVWAAGLDHKSPGIATITDPGFENRLDLNAKAFSWYQEHQVAGITVSQNTNQHHSGSTSLLVEWNGHAAPGVPVIAQLAVVESNGRYRLSFFVRTEEVVTGGLPVIVVSDGKGERVLGESKPFPQGSRDWQEFGLDFETGANTEAVIITLQRQDCAAPCPMFGRVWLDDFSLSRQK